MKQPWGTRGLISSSPLLAPNKKRRWEENKGPGPAGASPEPHFGRNWLLAEGLSSSS